MAALQTEDYLVFEGPDGIRLQGHRIHIRHIVQLYRHGYSPEQIALEYPGVSLEQIHFVIAYYLHNRADIDAMIARIHADDERAYQAWLQDPQGGQSPLIRRLRTLKEQRERDAVGIGERSP
jgi:uncharacterized protein (DUF433 family)